MILDKHHPVYMAWCNMKTRCNNPKSTQWKWYGARGIHYCKEWERFENFYDDLMDTWSPGLTLDRKDNDGHYSKNNCRWITSQEQSWNRRKRSNDNKCLRGHILTDNNVLLYANGSRTCKTCKQIYNNLHRDTINLNKRLKRQGKDSVKFNDIKENS